MPHERQEKKSKIVRILSPVIKVNSPNRENGRYPQFHTAANHLSQPVQQDSLEVIAQRLVLQLIAVIVPITRHLLRPAVTPADPGPASPRPRRVKLAPDGVVVRF